MDKKKQMNFNLNNFLLALTNILDIRDMEVNNVTESHSLRIAYVSLTIATQIKLQPKQMFDLCAYSLLHNTINDAKIQLLGIDNKSNILSSIVNFAHHIDEKYDFSNKNISNRDKIITFLQQDNINAEYSNILLEMTSTIDFWLDCQSSNIILQYIYSSLYDFTEILTFEEVLKRTIMCGSLYENTESFLGKCQKMIKYYNFEEKDQWTFLIAASMVNFGKLSLNRSIVEKNDKLTSDEYEMLKSNIYHNKNALSSIYGFDDISKWATRHQEQLDGKGYPSGIGANNLSLKDRLMSVLNIYNSLVSHRPYRNAFSHSEAMKILTIKAKDYHLDEAIVKDVDNIFK